MAMGREAVARGVALLGLLALLELAAACAPTPMYPGPERPASEVALLRGSSNASIHAIDGVHVAGVSWALLPGEHEVWLRVRIVTHAPNMQWDVWSYCRVPLRAVAGEEYVGRVRTHKEIAPGLAEKVTIEIGIADSQGAMGALAAGCSGKRPRFES